MKRTTWIKILTGVLIFTIICYVVDKLLLIDYGFETIDNLFDAGEYPGEVCERSIQLFHFLFVLVGITLIVVNAPYVFIQRDKIKNRTVLLFIYVAL